jgi:SAM-dependent methyltransferase
VSWKKFLLIPRLVALTARAPREQAKAWDGFWTRVRRTGKGGDVLWDLDSDAEWEQMRAFLAPHLDPALPVVDAGCGNGRMTRRLARVFPRAVGVDHAPAAVARAREESAGLAGVDHRVVDLTRPGAVAALSAEIGPANVFVRGVLHIVPPDALAVFVANLRALLGGRGSLYVIESDFHGDPLDHLEFQGATAGEMPEPLRLVISSGARAPAHFSEREMAALFPRDRWDRVAGAAAFLHTLPMHNRGRAERDELSAYQAVFRARG